MKRILMAGVALALLAPATAFAQSAFDGTWKADLGSAQMPKKPDQFMLKDGMYSCKTCVPSFTVKADGSDQAITGNKYIDTVAIKVVDDHTIQETDKKGGKTVTTSSVTVAADGKTADFEFSDSSNSNGAPVTGKGTEMRVGAMPKGAHAISGSWRTTSFSTMSDNGLTVTYKTDGDMITMTTPTGQSYTAKMDGTEAPITGDPGLTTVSVKKMGKNTMQETDKRDGKVISVAKMTIGADGKTMTVAYQNKERGTSMSWKAMKE